MTETATARTATLDELLKTVVPLFVSPPPSKRRLKSWLDRARVSRCKANPLASRGGGQVYYNVSGVEKYFRRRMGL